MTINEIQIKANNISSANAEMVGALQDAWPLKCKIEFHIQQGQKNASTGSVVGYDPRGYVRVEHDQAKGNSRYRYRSVHFGSVL